MNVFRFSKHAQKIFGKLPKDTQERIREKLQEFKKHPSIFSILEPVTDIAPATHRLRIGDYRLLLVSEGKGKFTVVKVGHRREIYR